ncbi:MAG TPA: carboxypeptidase-like regulatory domain-containing protein [Candidatus Saccharicenans sp.]|nr:carboxypeptidase-like regulatory domain-containing protein [Candidatus Saccharicenans sp.]
MSVRKRTLVVCLAILFMTASLLLAQTKELAEIKGRVTDDSGDPLPGVAVTVSSPSMMGKPSTITDEEGFYRIPGLFAGTYTVEATLSGFVPAKVSGVEIHAGMTATIDIILSQAKIEAEVTVIGAAPIVDISKATLANTYISKELLTSLPTQQDTHQILNLAPGVTQYSAY